MNVLGFIAMLIGIVLGWGITGVLMFWVANRISGRSNDEQ